MKAITIHKQHMAVLIVLDAYIDAKRQARILRLSGVTYLDRHTNLGTHAGDVSKHGIEYCSIECYHKLGAVGPHTP